MRALLLIPLNAATIASANPKPVDLRHALISAYLNSEDLQVSISATDAVFAGAFTFAAPHNWPGGCFVDLYIWLPEDSTGDPTVETFWKALGRGDLLTTNSVHWKILQRALRLSIRVEERKLKPGNGIKHFSVTHYRPPVLPTPAEERAQAIFRQRYGTPEPDKLEEPGFCLLTVQFVDNGTLISNRTPVTLSYRQPLAICAGGARFFYMPVFDGVPDRIFTADTNRYSITLVARGCSLAVTNGTQRATLDNGGSATFAPERHQQCRATATARSNPQGGANGRQPVNSEADRTSATAASRRSP